MSGGVEAPEPQERIELPEALAPEEIKELLRKRAAGNIVKSPKAFESWTQVTADPLIWISLTRVNEERTEARESTTDPGSVIATYEYLDDLSVPTGRAWEPGDYVSARSGSFEAEACSGCGGRGRLACEECLGKRSVDCSCGSGAETCPACLGLIGTDKCLVCEGKGWRTCSTCDGELTHPCERCSGEGEYDCELCEGSGRLTYYTQGRLVVEVHEEVVAHDPLGIGLSKASGSGELEPVVLDPSKAPWNLSGPLAAEVTAMLERRDRSEARRSCVARVVPATSVSDNQGQRTAWIVGTDNTVIAKGGYSAARILTAVTALLAAALVIGVGVYLGTKPTEEEKQRAAQSARLEKANQERQAQRLAQGKRLEASLRRAFVGSWRAGDMRVKLKIRDDQLQGSGFWIGDVGFIRADCEFKVRESDIESKRRGSGYVWMDEVITYDPGAGCEDTTDVFTMKRGRKATVSIEGGRPMRLQRD